MSTNTNRPRYYAYTKASGTGKTPWIRIGAAFTIKEGKGLSVKLNALPIDGQVLLFEPKPETD